MICASISTCSCVAVSNYSSGTFSRTHLMSSYHQHLLKAAQLRKVMGLSCLGSVTSHKSHHPQGKYQNCFFASEAPSVLICSLISFQVQPVTPQIWMTSRDHRKTPSAREYLRSEVCQALLAAGEDGAWICIVADRCLWL